MWLLQRTHSLKCTNLNKSDINLILKFTKPLVFFSLNEARFVFNHIIDDNEFCNNFPIKLEIYIYRCITSDKLFIPINLNEDNNFHLPGDYFDLDRNSYCQNVILSINSNNYQYVDFQRNTAIPKTCINLCLSFIQFNIRSLNKIECLPNLFACQTSMLVYIDIPELPLQCYWIKWNLTYKWQGWCVFNTCTPFY